MMRCNRTTKNDQVPLTLDVCNANRGGLTLTDVLMSMLIMAVGVSYVASLFPLAMLRSIHATQLTSATLLRYNAESRIRVDPDLIHDPNGNYDPNRNGIVEDANNNPPPNPLPVVPESRFGKSEHFSRPDRRYYIVDPLGFHTALADATTLETGFGNDGSTLIPNLNGTALLPRFDGGLLNRARAKRVPGPVLADVVRQQAADLVTVPDRWETHVDAVRDPSQGFVYPFTTDANSNVTSVTFGTNVDLSSIPVPGLVVGRPDPQLARIVLYDLDGRTSQVYPITGISGSTVTWTEDILGSDVNQNGVLDSRPLPGAIIAGCSRIRLEVSRSQQYSWLATVRKRAQGQANVDIVVAFNRGFDPAEELAYQATFVKGSPQVGIIYGSNPVPTFKKGAHVLDLVNARWYRIENYQTQSTLINDTIGNWDFPGYDAVLSVSLPGGGYVSEAAGEDQIVLNNMLDTEDGNSNGVLDSGEDLNGNGRLDVAENTRFVRNAVPRDGNLDYGWAVLMPGIVDVYPLGTFPLE